VSWKGQVAQSGVCGGADAVFDPGMAAVPQFQLGELPTTGVGEEAGDTQPIGVGEAELCAGVGSFLAQDQSGVFRPGSQVGHASDFGDLGTVAGLAHRQRRTPPDRCSPRTPLNTLRHGVCSALVFVESTATAHHGRRPAMQANRWSYAELGDYRAIHSKV
jgi:hypothetical protein